jgi:hypothetical protein
MLVYDVSRHCISAVIGYQIKRWPSSLETLTRMHDRESCMRDQSVVPKQEHVNVHNKKSPWPRLQVVF